MCVCIESQGPIEDVCCSKFRFYSVTERDSATTQNRDMIVVLQDLRQHLPTEKAARIDELLASVSCIYSSNELLTDRIDTGR